MLTLNCPKNKDKEEGFSLPQCCEKYTKLAWGKLLTRLRLEPRTEELPLDGARNTLPSFSAPSPCALCSLCLTALLGTQFPPYWGQVAAGPLHNLGQTWAWNLCIYGHIWGCSGSKGHRTWGGGGGETEGREIKKGREKGGGAGEKRESNNPWGWIQRFERCHQNLASLNPSMWFPFSSNLGSSSFGF